MSILVAFVDSSQKKISFQAGPLEALFEYGEYDFCPVNILLRSFIQKCVLRDGSEDDACRRRAINASGI